MFSTVVSAWFAAILLLPTANSQFLSFPRCIRTCIDQSQYSNCQVSDIACLCRASAGNFLPDVVTCVRRDCVQISTDILLGPLQFACELAGAPIPDSAVESAKDQASSQVTATVTTGASVRVSTVLVTTTEEGSTRTLIYPVTIQRTTTISGEPSTITTPSRGATGLIPIVVTSTDSNGSTFTTTASGSRVTSAYTTTNSDGSTITLRSTFTNLASGPTESLPSSFNSDDIINTRTTVVSSTSVGGTTVTSVTSGPSTTSTAPSGTNSAPFTNSNGAAATNADAKWLGLTVMLLLACIWF